MNVFVAWIVRLAIIVVLAAIAVVLLVLSWTGETWSGAVAAAQGMRGEAIWMGIALLLLAILGLVVAIRGAIGAKFVRVQGARAVYSVELAALSAHIRNLASEFPAIRSARPRIHVSKDQVSIVVSVVLELGPNAQETCDLYQRRIRTSLHADFGIAELRALDIRVRKTVAADTRKTY